MESHVHRVGRAPLRLAAGVIICACLLLIAGCGVSGPTCSDDPKVGTCTRVLFLGNSYTYVNDLPSTFANLARSGGQPVQVDMVANGGETLAEHATAVDDQVKITAHWWSYVVLQEQSQTPAFPGGRDLMYPAARTLAGRIEAAGAVPMFFMTWAHRDGLPEAGLDYESMQVEIDNAYYGIAKELSVPVAPVGFTWFIVRHDHPGIALWGDDGSHPDGAGTYLAACVFYASIFRKSPVGISWHGGVSDDQARILQDEAGRHVLELQSEWGLR
ncbi:MAG: DUF4886 domain-containing protein [Candidatus Limnocylindrales bacterium]